MTSPNANIAVTLWETAALEPDRVALRDLTAGREMTYAELRDAAGRLAAGLIEEGLRPGDRVALLLHNSCDYVIAFMGALTTGAVVVPLNTRLTVQDFDYMMKDAGATLLVTEPAFLEALRADTSIALPRRGRRYRRDRRRTDARRHLSRVVHRAARAKSRATSVSLMYTSGTTGAPKAVMLSHGAWNSVSDTCVDLLDFTDGISVMHPAPPYPRRRVPPIAHAATRRRQPAGPKLQRRADCHADSRRTRQRHVSGAVDDSDAARCTAC